jgi:hypothetical protein
MAKISQFRTSTALSRSLVREPKTLSQLYGREGQQLTKKLDKVTQDIRKYEPIQRLLKDLEEVNEKRHQDLQIYLDSLRSEAKSTGESEFTELVIHMAWQVWERLRSHFLSNDLCLEVPDACPGQRDNFMYTWSKGEHYFECEIFGSGEVEFFYRNRNSSEVWGEDTTLEQEFSTNILDRAALFTW